MYTDRIDAGRVLAAALLDARAADPSDSIIVALPRGGVPVAAEVARLLGMDLDVLVVRKVGAPFEPEYALGAVGEDGVVVIDQAAVSRVGLDADRLAALVAGQQLEVARRAAGLRSRFPRVELRGATAVVVDDGLATGATAAAAVDVARRHGAARVVVAVPVGSRQAVEWLSSLADAVVCPLVPEPFVAVGHHYDDFRQVTDAEVEAALSAARP